MRPNKVETRLQLQKRVSKSTETGWEISYRLGQKGFHGVELLFPRGVISFSKFNHRPSDQAYSQS